MCVCVCVCTNILILITNRKQTHTNTIVNPVEDSHTTLSNKELLTSSMNVNFQKLENLFRNPLQLDLMSTYCGYTRTR